MTSAAGETTPGASSGFLITVPFPWSEFDIHPAVRDKNIREVVRSRVRANPELAHQERDLAKALRKLCRTAWQEGVVYCGSLAELIDGEVPLVANITVALVRARDKDGTALSTSPIAIMTSVDEIPKGKRPTDPWRQVVLVDLPEAGPAARTQGIEDIDLPDTARPMRVVMMQTFVAVPGTDEMVAVITGLTPQLELADPMLELFGLITDTFEFLPAAEPAN